MSTVGLMDTIEMTSSDSGRVELSSDLPGLAVDGTNLILRAGAALALEAGIVPSARVMLHKHIPMGGGLGGGSSNAAGALMGFNRLWGLNWPVERLAQIGARLGADVPFFFHGPSSVCTGRGERVMPIERATPRWVVLIFPQVAMSTPAVYRQFDQLNLGSTHAIERQPHWDRWTKLSAEELSPNLANDLEPPAFALCPQLGEIRQKIEKIIGRIVRMSGSGSTLFTLADDRARADETAAKIERLGLQAGVFELGAQV